MLVLSRKQGESIRIGKDVVLTVVRAIGTVRLGIEAPKEQRVLRTEIENENRQDHEGHEAS